MKILITGSSGLVGSALQSFLQKDGHDIKRLVRSQPTKANELFWNPDDGVLDATGLEGIDAVVHLAGESIAEGRWTGVKKARIRDSRVKGTTLLSQKLASLKQPPAVLVSASALGYYGNRGDELLTEESSPGSGFLADVCRQWEASTEPAATKGIRIAIARFGLILSKNGGALAKMLLPFRMGAGGQIGSGEQYWSWIDIDDVVRVIDYAMTQDSIRGAINVATPTPVTNAEFTRTLGEVLRRPAVIPIPGMAARAVFGEMANHLLLASARLQPARLIEAGFEFHYPELHAALYHQLA